MKYKHVKNDKKTAFFCNLYSTCYEYQLRLIFMKASSLKILLNVLLTFFLIMPAFAVDMEGVRTYLADHKHNIEWAETEQNVFIEVYLQQDQVKGKETIPVIIEQIIRPEWHTYWKNPGDSGEPLRANWELPEGFALSDISWPTPQKLPFDPLMNYGYENGVFLYQELLIPESIPEGEINIDVRFDILVCKEICIPESVEKTITLNGQQETSDHTVKPIKFFREALSYMPIKAEAHGWTADIGENNGNLVLNILGDINEPNLQKHIVEFFPYEYGVVDNPSPPSVSYENNQIILTQKRGEFSFDRIENLGGVLVLEDKRSGDRFGYELKPTLSDNIATANTEPSTETKTEEASSTETTDFDVSSVGLGQALLFALIGGLILNLMPCVFPVLSMKVLSLSKISEKSKQEAQLHGMAYTAGIIVSFLAIAGLLIALKAGGSGIGWGFHLQNPVVILLLAYLFFAIGLNLSGFFEIGTRLMGIGQGSQSSGLRGSFMTGVLATVVATPCTAPFMAAALGYALVQPAYIALLIFGTLGLGLALPYLLVSFVPALQKAMPRPGTWMVTFKELLAFPMFATVIWLLSVLSSQVGMNGIAFPLMGLLGISFAIWLHKHAGQSKDLKKIFLTILALLTLGSSLFFTIYKVQTFEMSKEKPMPELGISYSETALEDALKTEHPVFVEMTAAWCVTCKVNHYRAIGIPETVSIMKERDIIFMIGDWTNYDAEITKYLNKFGRNGVPIYIYYGRPDPETGKRPDPEMLPQILSPDIIAEALDR